jgi:hypothetical protein
MFPREKKFWRAYLSVRPSVFRRWIVFLFATELAMEKRVTDDYYTDRHVPSVMLSVIISPTKFIPVTDRISLSVKLFNGVVFVKLWLKIPFYYKIYKKKSAGYIQ